MATILIVDDSETVRTQLRNDLAGEGYRVIEASTGLEGLKRIDEHVGAIDLIFCDVNMPDMDGLSMCRELHKDPIAGKVPIFMLTTQTSAEMKAEGKASGVIAWIVKPYEKRKVLNGVTRILSPAPHD